MFMFKKYIIPSTVNATLIASLATICRVLNKARS